MISVSIFYRDLPVTVTDEEYQAYTGRDLKELISASNESYTSEFLDRAHEAVYMKIYTGSVREFKHALIRANLDKLTKPIKTAIISQISYMLDSGGDYATADLSNIDEKGTVTLVDNNVIRSKITAPNVIEILSRTTPRLCIVEEAVANEDRVQL